MSRTYVIADLHGRFDLLEAALVRLAEREPAGATLVFTGDYVDRGAQSRQIIERLMAGPPQGWSWVCLKGNHEAMMVETLRKPLHPEWWVRNGGGATLISYGHAEHGVYDPSVVPDAHLDWLDALPIMHVDLHRVYVHAGVVADKPLHEQSADVVTWMRYADDNEGGHGDFHVVHGHEQFADGPKFWSGRTDLDTFAWATGRLVVGVFDDETPGGPVDLIEIIGSPDERYSSAA